MPEDYSSKLNPEQKRAVEHDKGPLLIVAGAGTGKTTVITQRIDYLIKKKKVKPEEILALTFTDKAAGEMEERVDFLLPFGYTDLWILTFHSFAEKILQQHALEIGIPNDFKLLNQTEQWMLVRQNLDKFNLDYYKPLGNPTKFIHALVKLFSRAKDEVIRPEDFLKYAEDLKLNADSDDYIQDFVTKDELKNLTKKERKELIAQEIAKNNEVAEAYHVYQQLLLEHNSLDFGDLINYCLQLFQKRPRVLAKYRALFKYILVDEFQDTNYAQYELVKLLAAPKNNVTVVGDDDQSIYKFRGASVSNILEFKKDYPKAAEIFLTTNYRSTQNILDLSYKFIVQNNPNRLEVKLAKAGKKLSKKLKSSSKAKGEIKHLHFDKADDEIKGVLRQISELKEKDKQASWNDFAILARTNDMANNFATTLSQTQIPYWFVASRGLYTKSVILDVLAYLRLLDNYHESNAVYRILNSPVVGLEHKTIVQLNYWARRKGYSLYTTLQQPATAKSDSATAEKIQKFLGWVSKHSQLAKEKSVTQIIVAFLDDTGYREYLSVGNSVEIIQAANYLNQFYRKVVDFEQATEDRSVKNFLEFIDLELEAGETGSLQNDVESGPEALKVMTIHAAKGLEFKYVWIVGMVDRRFPIDNRPDPITIPDKLVKEMLPEGDVHTQEERRLMYVAMTRAKQALFMTSAADYGGARKKKLSKFLNELEGFGLKLDGKADTVEDSGFESMDDVGSQTKLSEEDLKSMIPTRFSFSQLNSFINCPYHYWLDYILKIPQKGKDIFSFGTSIHSTLQQFFILVRQRSQAGQADMFVKKSADDKPKVSEKELLEIYKQKWIDDWYQSRNRHDEYKIKGEKMLKQFYQTYTKEIPIPKFLETPFNIHILSNGQSYSIVGKMDRIDHFNGGVEIIDYKTGQSKTSDSLSTDDKQQLLIYQIAAEEHLGEKVKQLTYYYLGDGTRASFVGKKKELDNLKKKIIDTIHRIENTKFPLGPEDCTCRNKDLRIL